PADQGDLRGVVQDDGRAHDENSSDRSIPVRPGRLGFGQRRAAMVAEASIRVVGGPTRRAGLAEGLAASLAEAIGRIVPGPAGVWDLDLSGSESAFLPSFAEAPGHPARDLAGHRGGLAG